MGGGGGGGGAAGLGCHRLGVQGVRAGETYDCAACDKAIKPAKPSRKQDKLMYQCEACREMIHFKCLGDDGEPQPCVAAQVRPRMLPPFPYPGAVA